MTLSQIQCFLIVAEKLSITEAANAMFVTQPAVSHRIRNLEQELGTELFDRDSSRIVLTSAGQKYAAFFNSFIDGLKNIKEEIESESFLSDTVTVGFTDGWDISEVYNLTKQSLAEDYPGITMKLECCSNDELIAGLNSSSLDAALALESIFIGSEMDVVPVKEIRGSLIYSKEHPLAGKENLFMADFREYPFYVIISPKNSFGAADIVQFFARSGFSPKIEYVNSLSAALVKLRTMNGVLVADEFLIQKQNQLFRSLDIDLKRVACVGVRKNASRADRIVRDRLEDACRTLWG